MKILNSFIYVALLMGTQVCQADHLEELNQSSEERVTIEEQIAFDKDKITIIENEELIDDLKLNDIDFSQLTQELNIDNLFAYLKNEQSIFSSFLNTVHYQPYSSTSVPIAQGFMYVQGILCHVANYPYFTICTTFEGPQYGLQTVIDYNGVVLYVNPEYILEYTPFGVTFKHFYNDSMIITGADQVVFSY